MQSLFRLRSAARKSGAVKLCALIMLLFTLPVFAKNTILILGDSLSAAYGMDVSQGWVELLKGRLNDKGYSYQVVNLSVSGATTSNALAALPEALKTYTPSVTVIEIGGNDGLRGIQLLALQANLQRIISLILAANSKVLLLGVRLPPNFGSAYNKQFENVYIELAKKNEISVVPYFLQHIDDKPDLMSADGIHPKASAQTIMLDNVWPDLQKLLEY